MPARRRLLAPACALALVASFVAAPSAWAAGAAPAEATATQRRDAQTHYDKGRKAYLAGNYSAAIDEFRASFDVVASPNTSLYLARALRENGQLADAYTEFGRTSTSANGDARYAKTAQIAATESQALEAQLGFVTVHVEHATPDTKLEIAGHEVPSDRAGGPVAVAPGSVSVTVTKPGHEPVTKTVTVAAGAKDEVSLDADATVVASAPPPSPPPPAAEPSRPPLRTYAYVAGGVGVVGVLTFVVAGLMANSTYGDLQDKCGSSPCPSSLGDEISRGKTQQTIANIGLVVGVVGVAAGVTLFVLSNKQKDAPAPSATTAFVAGPSFTGLRGAF